jgi:hypothetical protein
MLLLLETLAELSSPLEALNQTPKVYREAHTHRHHSNPNQAIGYSYERPMLKQNE